MPTPGNSLVFDQADMVDTLVREFDKQRTDATPAVALAYASSSFMTLIDGMTLFDASRAAYEGDYWGVVIVHELSVDVSLKAAITLSCSGDDYYEEFARPVALDALNTARDVHLGLA